MVTTHHPDHRATKVVPQPIDAVVSNITYYVKICEQQSAVFRQHVEESTKEFALYTQSADVVKPGHSWIPSTGDRDAYMAEMARRCSIVPQSIADRVKIYCAAHAILACTVFVDLEQHTQNSVNEILAKSNKICREELLSRAPVDAEQSPPAPFTLIRSTPNPPKQPLTANDRKRFEQDPTTLADKQFILEEKTGDLLFEIVEVRFSKGVWAYQVRFEGCSDSLPVPNTEMVDMLKRSSSVVI